MTKLAQLIDTEMPSPWADSGDVAESNHFQRLGRQCALTDGCEQIAFLAAGTSPIRQGAETLTWRPCETF